MMFVSRALAILFSTTYFLPGLCDQAPLLALVSSSTFTLELRPTESPLSENSINHVEASLTATISTRKTAYIELEAVVRSAEFVPGSSENHPTTVMKFVVLATVLNRDKDENHRDDLNALVHQIFITSSREKNRFLALLRQSSNAQLQPLGVAQVLPLEMGTLSSEADDRMLSSLDIFLIILSILICSAICFMLYEHFADQGHYENERMRAARAELDDKDDDGSVERLSTSHESIDQKLYPNHIAGSEFRNMALFDTPTRSNASADVDIYLGPSTTLRVHDGESVQSFPDELSDQLVKVTSITNDEGGSVESSRSIDHISTIHLQASASVTMSEVTDTYRHSHTQSRSYDDGPGGAVDDQRVSTGFVDEASV